MIKRRTLFLSDYIVNQYPVEKFRELIFITLDIVETFLLILESGFSYNSSTVSSYEYKYGSRVKNTSSKIESILIKNMNDEEKMVKFLNSYYYAYKSLNEEEKEIFDSTFIDRMTDTEIINNLRTNSRHIGIVRKSAIVKFCLKSGLDRFVDVI